MKLEQVSTTINPTDYKIFCDLDGVLVDFDTTTEKITGVDVHAAMHDKKLKRIFWQRLSAYSEQGKNKTWEIMNPMHDAQELWNYIKKYNPTILSATGKVPSEQIVTAEKHVWIKKHLGNVPTILVQTGADKAKYATPTGILIDDKYKALNPWIAAGGIGVLHTSAANTIKQLKELGL